MYQLSLKVSPYTRSRLEALHAALRADPVRSLHGEFTMSHTLRVALYRALCQWRAAHPDVPLLKTPRQGRRRRTRTLPNYEKYSIQIPESLLCLLDSYALHSDMTRCQAFRDALDNGLML